MSLLTHEENTRIAGEKITVYDYPDGTLAFKYGYRSLKYQVFDKLECLDQGQIVDNGEPAEFGKNRTLRFSGHP
ncbi:hypothetical protein KPGSU103_P20390 (plasmid) [Klebsiella pneumoniae]|nr:hypothetical protein P828_05074 [Klebsiella pneumoniae UCI 25]OVU12742.1 hypothetical protein BMD95_23140 [Klebsiella pneumoniae]SBZ57730.1 Sea24 [Klebsiella pneumoniae]SSI90314.1 Sea24 [Klebsiella pneumoniae]SVX43754.1 Sea24 [Klebsiella pneumoniae]